MKNYNLCQIVYFVGKWPCNKRVNVQWVTIMKTPRKDDAGPWREAVHHPLCEQVWERERHIGVERRSFLCIKCLMVEIKAKMKPPYSSHPEYLDWRVFYLISNSCCEMTTGPTIHDVRITSSQQHHIRVSTANSPSFSAALSKHFQFLYPYKPFW